MRFLRGSLIVAAAVGSAMGLSAQSTTYAMTGLTYAGANFLNLSGPCLNGHCANFNGVPNNITSFSFFDGLTTYSSSDPNVALDAFVVTTNSSGAITATRIDIERWVNAPGVGAAWDYFWNLDGSQHNVTCTTTVASSLIVGSTNSTACLFGTITAQTTLAIFRTSPTQTWTSTAAIPVPVPALSSLNLVCLAGAADAGWCVEAGTFRRRRPGRNRPHGLTFSEDQAATPNIAWIN